MSLRKTLFARRFSYPAAILTQPGCLFSCFIAIKISLLIGVGPLLQPDSAGYIDYAQHLIKGAPSLTNSDTLRPDITTLRMIGYPALLAAAQIVIGSHWAWGVAAIQSLVNLLAVALAYRTGRNLTRSSALGMAIAGCYAVSPTLQYDLSLLTDSLYGNLLAILTALLSSWYLEQRRPTALRLFGSGSLLAIALLIRSGTMPLGFLFLIPAAFWISDAEKPMSAIGPARYMFRWSLGLVLFAAPFLMTDIAYLSWNRARTGQVFLATDVRLAILQPLVSYEAHGVPVFIGDTPLDHAANAVFAIHGRPTRDTVVPQMYNIADTLTNEAGVDALAVQRLVTDRYFKVMQTQPAAFLSAVFRELTSKALFTPFDPVRVMRNLLTTDFSVRPSDLRKRSLTEGGWWGLAAYLVAEGMTRLIAIVLVAGFLLTLPISLGPSRQGDPNARLRLALLLVASGFIGATAMIHLESRYIIGVMPALILTSTATLSDTRLRRWLSWRRR